MSRRECFILLSFIIGLLISRDALSGTDPMESFIPKVSPKGWALKDTPEVFTKETLFEHIDGQAELFFQYGFQKSIFFIYQNIDDSENRMDVDMYDMGNPLQAFGVFSRFRQQGHPARIGLDSCLGDQYALF